jgi:hypothetical protein
VRAVNAATQGKVYPTVQVEVTHERLADFRAVFGQDRGVPPTFATTVEFMAFAQVAADPELALDFTRVVHGGQEFEHRRPMREGEVLDATIRVDSIRVKGTNGFLVVVTDIVDTAGELVCTAKSTMVERAPA